MGCAVRCDAMLCFHVAYIHVYKMADDDDNDALVLSEYQKRNDLMHINLYWSLISSSLLVLARW